MASVSSSATDRTVGVQLPRFARLDGEQREQVVRLLMELLEHSWEDQTADPDDDIGGDVADAEDNGEDDSKDDGVPADEAALA